MNLTWGVAMVAVVECGVRPVDEHGRVSLLVDDVATACNDRRYDGLTKRHLANAARCEAAALGRVDGN